MEVVYFLNTEGSVYITEFAHSLLDRPKSVGPYVRSTYILHYVLNGTCHFDSFEANAGEAFLISKGKLHSFKVEPGYHHVWVAFDGEKATELLQSFGLDPYQHAKLTVADRNFADTLCEAAIASVKTHEDVKVAESWLYAMLSLLSEPKAATATVDSSIITAAKFLEQHYHRRITMQQVADFMHISEKHFCKQFKRQFGVPPQEFLMNIRLEKAKQLLKSTDLRIKEIAGSVGFSSQLNFAAAFKKRFGQSPTAYRTK